MSGSRQSKILPATGESGPRIITRVDEYEINPLAKSCMTQERRRESMTNEVGENEGEMPKQPWDSLGAGKI